MTMTNFSFCNKCRNLVPTTSFERDNMIWLAKDCPDCGRTETVTSSIAKRYNRKRLIDRDPHYEGCKLNCLQCKHKDPNIVFVDITNRCNLDCPICINNTPGMGFLFEPPIEYFDKIFQRMAKFDPPPAVQIFGGEPTVRKDLFDIIKMAKSYGISARVVTNGLKLADEDYCREMIKSRATILIAYDGENTEMYKKLRGSEKCLALKKKALENINKFGAKKAVFMSLAAKGFNTHEFGSIFEQAHRMRSSIRGVFFMPLAHMWKTEDFDLDPERITAEDIEEAVSKTFPGYNVEFLPASFLGQVQTFVKYIWVRPPPFAGAHPNCESLYVLISDGEKYLPVDHFFKRPVTSIAQDVLKVEDRLAPSAKILEARTDTQSLSFRFKKNVLMARAMWALIRVGLKNIYIGRTLKGKSIGKLWHGVCFPFAFILGSRTQALLRHTNIQGTLQIIVLPFEDPQTLETHRMERCPSAFAFYDPKADKVNFVPVCAWPLHKKRVMREVSEFYGQAKPAPVKQAAAVPAGA
jgi:7,8-dihydro-6-hydroxymethylpterin dimethyltransferase